MDVKAWVVGRKYAELVAPVEVGRGVGHGRRCTAYCAVPVEDIEGSEGERGDEVAILL